MKPAEGEYPTYFGTYISKVKEDDCVSALENTEKEFLSFFKSIPENKGDFAYAPGKWTIKQLIIHISDAERIFAYRALRFARRDEQQNLSFEEDDYAKNCEADKRTLRSVIEEFAAVRRATILLFKSFSDQTLQNSGNMSSGKTTVNALGFTISGHAAHHVGVVKERYL
ncbi:MAG TPA: DinB family protein [Bacteroidia bacterium]|jgi:hypothetical protein|nr:DinB family protein [Bacteroidia bacterium]